MPIYEYQCQKCGHEFEREQRIVEDPIKTCPACKAQKAKRLISNTSFLLKGGGWHEDLYSSSSGKKDSSDDAGAKSDSGSDEKKESKKESKEPKSDSKSSDKKKKSKDKSAA